jgi:hypothetical protein
LDDDAANLRAKANAEKKKRNMGYGVCVSVYMTSQSIADHLHSPYPKPA